MTEPTSLRQFTTMFTKSRAVLLLCYRSILAVLRYILQHIFQSQMQSLGIYSNTYLNLRSLENISASRSRHGFSSSTKREQRRQSNVLILA